MSWMLGRGILVTLLCALTACTLDPFALTGDGGGQLVDAADGDATGPQIDARDPADARPDAPPECVPLPEQCNGADEDCDDEVDEDFDLQNDPRNCGACGKRCDVSGMAGVCELGECVYSCLSCFHDNDGDATPVVDDTTTNGCEYTCCFTLGGEAGVETCDGLDNDCDGQFDEDFSVDDDPLNCGRCNTVCQAVNATPTCTDGTCGFGACASGYADILPGVSGCEYFCPVFPPVAEICDGIDQDCDGVIDNGNPGGGAACGTDEGACEAGTSTCIFGVSVCVGGRGPASLDICDGIDNDCDASIDEGFDKDNDPTHCGPSCRVCNLPGAIEGCVAGACTVSSCLQGRIDRNGLAADGCEITCTASGPEVCDGLDNDCDGLIDAADPGILLPSNFCRSAGTCAGTTPTCGTTTCATTPHWRCDYGGFTELDECGDLTEQEILCDELDGDCDGVPDDGYDLKNTPCTDDEQGVCQGTGLLVCAADNSDLECLITDEGSPSTTEVCDGLDNDCDGVKDDGAPNAMVHVVATGVDYWIDRYEASKPDATASNQGVMEHRSCAKAGVQPWRSVTYTEASAACLASGRRLCTEAENTRACAGPSGFRFPYGNVYDPDACNGRDYDPGCVLPDNDVPLATGSAMGCPTPVAGTCESDGFVSTAGAFDLSGNLKEWTSTQVSTVPVAYRIKGGAYDNTEDGLACDFNFVAAEPGYYFTNLGFRCCDNEAP